MAHYFYVFLHICDKIIIYCTSPQTEATTIDLIILCINTWLYYAYYHNHTLSSVVEGL